MENRVVFYLVLSLFELSNVDATISVDTGIGRIIGTEETITERGKQFQLKTFLGIPYAKSPIGELRWEKPLPTEAFKEPFMATQYGPACPQLDNQWLAGYKDQSEDCLSLNIYVPSQHADKPSGHAVMVFIHGGGLEMGAASSYIADSLSVLGNVIVVTINYRVGIFGFLSTGDERIPGNMGFFDQHLALKWINQNIAAFGGDPGRVTIFGESAGGSSVVFQGLFPENEGLFQRVISQSGVPHMAGAFNLDPKPQFEFIVKSYGCEADSVEESIKCLKRIDLETVITTLKDLTNSEGDYSNAMYVHFLASIDGALIKKDYTPIDIREKLKTDEIPSVNFFRSLDLMIGYNNHDGAMFAAMPEFTPNAPDMDTFLPSREDFINQLINMPIALYFGFDVEVHTIVKSLIASQYTEWSNPNAPETTRKTYVDLWTDVVFGRGANDFAIVHANSTDTRGKTFQYIFSAPTSMHVLPTPSWVSGSNHGDDVGFVFGFNEKMISGLNETLSTDKLQDWEWDLSDRTIRYWSNFAKSADPNEPAETNPTWPQYDMVEQIALNIDKDMSEENQIRFFNAETNNLWMETIPAVLEALKQNPESSTSPYSRDQNTEGTEGTCDSDKGCENN